MGNLHDGHMALVEASAQRCDLTVVSIFVNPLQFGPNEDFDSYPRTLPADTAKLESVDVDLVFAPPVQEVLPPATQTVTVTLPALSRRLCGRSRPGHFDGVATIVAKLFNIVGADYAFFGEKDWQQLTLIQSMVQCLSIPTAVIGVPTVRAADGLALSSRNGYLSDAERAIAPTLYRTLCSLRDAIQHGDRRCRVLERHGRDALVDAGFEVDYVAVRDAMTLGTPRAESERLRILAAARLGKTRLIDNIDAGGFLPERTPEGALLPEKTPKGTPLPEKTPKGTPLLGGTPEGGPLLGGTPEGGPLPEKTPGGAPLPEGTPGGTL